MLTKSESSLAKLGSGYIINLVSKDLQPVENAITFAPFLVLGPVETLAVSILLWVLIGKETLTALAYVFLIVVFQFTMGNVSNAN